MKKKKYSLVAATALLVLGSITACKKITIGEHKNDGNSTLKSQLVGTPGHVWQLQDADASTVWEDQIGAGWVKYTNQPGTIVLTDCVKNNDYIVFNADYTYNQATYTCNLFETNFLLFKQTGGPGTWTLEADNTLALENYDTFRLISVSATDLVLADLHGTYHFASVAKLPFLTPVQHLAGPATRTWKIKTVKRGGVEQPLTADQLVARMTFGVDGTLTNSFTDAAFGQPVTGTWNYNLSQSKYVYTFPANGQTAAINQSCTVLELTETAFTYYYFDDKNNFFTLYLVPQ